MEYLKGGETMRVYEATVDKRPRECCACPIDGKVRARWPCGTIIRVKFNGSSKFIKIPNDKCALRLEKQ